MRQTTQHVLAILAVAAVVFFYNLGGPRLWDRDEPRNARCTAEMLEQGDWVVPVFNDELRTHKPILLYWFMMTAYSLFGVNEFAARFWSAALATGTALLTYAIGRRLFDAKTALWGAAILSTALMFDVAARAATPDSVLIFFSTAALTAFVYGAFPARKDLTAAEHLTPRPDGEALFSGTLFSGTLFSSSLGTVVLMYALMGMAMLAKGPVGLVLPTAVIGMYLLIMRLPTVKNTTSGLMQRALAMLRPFAPGHFLNTCWKMRPITALGVSLAVALPWYVWVHYRTAGAWTEGFFYTHNLSRAVETMESHNGSIFYYLVAVSVGFFPWSLFLGPLLIDVVRRIRQRESAYCGSIFLCCWVGVYVGIFSLVQTKLPSYVTPMYPALALLTAQYVKSWASGKSPVSNWWPSIAMVILAIVGIGLSVGVPIAATDLLPGEQWLGIIGVIPLTCALIAFTFIQRQRQHEAAVTILVMAVLFSVSLFGVAAQHVDQHQQSDKLLAAITDNHDNPEIASFGCHEPSWVFYARQPIKYIKGDESEKVEQFLKTKPNAFLITTQKSFEEMKDSLSPDVQLLTTQPCFLKNHNLVVVGRAAPKAQVARRQADRPNLRR